MSILNLKPVTRDGMRPLVMFYGKSQSGKTLSALLMASGYEPDPSKRALIDTEGGERGRAYVDEVPGGYMYAALSPPFTPDRLADAIDECAAAGINALVIDSASHIWFGQGGVLDMADQSETKDGRAKWKTPKAKFTRAMERIRQSDMAIFLCCRAKNPLEEYFDDKNKKQLRRGPLVPVFEAEMRYDMTIVAQMTGNGAFTVEAPAGKCPANMMHIMDCKLIGVEAGRKLRDWIKAAHKPIDLRLLETTAKDTAARGRDAMRAYWSSLTAPEKSALNPMLGNLQSIAQAADDERARAEAERAEATANTAHNLDDPFAAPAEPEPAPVTIAPAKATAAEVTVPMRPNGKPDWQGYVDALVAAAGQCESKDAIDALLTANGTGIAAMIQSSPDWKISLDEEIAGLIAA